MKILWDEPKRLANLEKHKLDFAIVTLAFFDDATVVSAKKDRWVAVGKIDDRAYAVIFSPLGSEAVAIVSLRPASRKERRLII